MFAVGALCVIENGAFKLALGAITPPEIFLIVPTVKLFRLTLISGAGDRGLETEAGCEADAVFKSALRSGLDIVVIGVGVEIEVGTCVLALSCLRIIAL